MDIPREIERLRQTLADAQARANQTGQAIFIWEDDFDVVSTGTQNQYHKSNVPGKNLLHEVKPEA